MRKIYSFLFFMIGIQWAAFAQCPTVVCPSDTIIYAAPSDCGAVFNYTSPVGTDPCSPFVADSFEYTGNIVNWTVPPGVTSVTIEARGAQGGTNNASSLPAGLGAIMRGDFAVTPGSTLKILVGENPTLGFNNGNGGGGGTFVTDAANNPLIIAGGGAGSHNTTATTSKHGNITTTGGTGSGGGGLGGTNGNGGTTTGGSSSFYSGAGGGLLTNGVDGWTTNTGGRAFVNGGAGATGNGNARGGFGGGGSGSSNVVGGAGGGYSGGGVGGNSTAGHGGGGGSFNGGTNQVNVGGATLGNVGHGLVIITSGTPSFPSTQTAGLASGATFPVGTTTNTFTVTNAGVTDSCSFNVIVLDTIAPVISCPNDDTVCIGAVTGIAATATDNCSGVTISYVLSGATVATGTGDASGSAFNDGVTTVTYTATDASGNTSSCSFNITAGSPSVTLASFSPDTICENSGLVALPAATPAGGMYTGSGVSGMNFDPVMAGLGTHTITYMYTDSVSGCTGMASTNVTVLSAPTVLMAGFVPDTVCSNAGLLSLPVGLPAGGMYMGSGVSGMDFDASVAGLGTHVITYTYTDSTTGCMGMDSTMVTVVNATVATLASFSPDTICENAGVMALPVGTPAGGMYMGAGVIGMSYNPSFAGVGTHVVFYTYIDSTTGCTSEATTTVTVVGAPTVFIASFNPDTICENAGVVALPVGLPAGGMYMGTGVSGMDFDPAVAGAGTQVVTYTYTDSTTGCMGMDSTMVVVQTCTNISKLEETVTFQVYPNPNTGAFVIDLGAYTVEATIEIYNTLGELVYNKEVQAQKVPVNLTETSAGTYFVRIRTARGQGVTGIIIK